MAVYATTESKPANKMLEQNRISFSKFHKLAVLKWLGYVTHVTTSWYILGEIFVDIIITIAKDWSFCFIQPERVHTTQTRSTDISKHMIPIVEIPQPNLANLWK